MDPIAPRSVVATASRLAPWLIALAGFALDLVAYWPGQMSFDSAYTWWQARGGETMNVTPPVLIFLWRFCDALLEGPGLVFALHLVLFWCGLALLADALRLAPARAFALMLPVAFAPVPWLLRGHVWTDVGLFSALVFALGAIAQAHATQRRAWLAVALPPLFYAAAIRHNALPAILPLAAWLAWLAAGRGASRWRVASVAGAIGIAAIGLTAVINAQVQRRVPLWPAAAEWDLAAISIATGEMLLPPFTIGPGLDVPELAAAFRHWSAVPMLVDTQHGMRGPFSDYTPEQLAALRSAWFDAIRAHPVAWLRHHALQAEALLGVHDPSWPRELIYFDGEYAYRDNPPVAPNETPLHEALMRAASRLVRTPLLAGWPYLAIGLVAVPLAWRRRGDLAGLVALIASTSAWLYLLPLIPLVPAELRYLGWSIFASLLAAALAIVVPRSFRNGPDTLAPSPQRTFR